MNRRHLFPEFNRVACSSYFNVSAYISVAIFRVNEVERALNRYSLWNSLWCRGLGCGTWCYAVGRDHVIKKECCRQIESKFIAAESACIIQISVLIGGCLTLRSLTLYIYGAPILDVSRSHTTTQQSR